MWTEVTWSRPVIFQLVCEDCVFCSLVQALCIDSEYCVSNEGKCLFNFKAKHLTHILQKCVRWLGYHLWSITGPFTERWLSSDDQTWESCSENEGIELRVCLYNMCFLSVSLCVWGCTCVCVPERNRVKVRSTILHPVCFAVSMVSDVSMAPNRITCKTNWFHYKNSIWILSSFQCASKTEYHVGSQRNILGSTQLESTSSICGVVIDR